MSKASKQRPISLQAICGDVRVSPSGTATFLDITFKCAFTNRKEIVSDSVVRVSRKELSNVQQLAEAAHGTICELLTKQSTTKRSAQ